LESTLFGVEKGAFTGALKSQDGKFVQAHEGTLFLDEIGDLPLDLQAKLLRVLQENRVEPVGSNRSVAIDLRVLSATHVDLEAAVREGRFRKDLFFRLAGSTIKLPALREREGDIQILAEYFLRQHGADRRLFFNAEALKKLSSYSWPGNIRELEQVIHRAVVFCEELEIQPTDIELHPVGIFDGESSGFHEDFRSLEDAQNAFTKEYVDKTIQQNSGSRTAAARRLGISERTLYRILATDSSGRTL
jgi:DNA-binding NtrC family response regulator